MLKFIIEYAILILCGLILLTQVIIPAFVPGLSIMWLFKPKKDLSQEVMETKQKKEEVQSSADRSFEEARKIKDMTDKI